DVQFKRLCSHGIDPARLPAGTGDEGFLVFAGRMLPEKGPDLAIEIARRAGKKLVMAGGIYDRGFFEEKIAPALKEDTNLIYRGVLGRDELYRLMGRAEGLLFSSRWAEPFGLVLVESLAAGTPVLAWRRGAVPEIVTDRKTSFICPFPGLGR